MIVRMVSMAVVFLAMNVLISCQAGGDGRAQPTSPGMSTINATAYGAIANDSLDDTAALRDAIEACVAGPGKTLYLPAGALNVTDITFPKSVHVVMSAGAMLEIEPQATVIFGGPFSAGLYTVFSDSGRVHFANAALEQVYPQWWPSPDGDDSIAIKKAIDSAPSLPGITVRLVGTFHCKTTVRIARHRAHILGTGQYATQLIFDPQRAAPLFEFRNEEDKRIYKTGSRMIVQCSIKDLTIMGARNNDVRKSAIKIVDADFIEVSGISIQRWTGNGSIGLQIQGRDMGYISNMSIVADLPISIEKNPNLWWISIDQFTFRNMWLQVMDDQGPAVNIESGVALTNVTFDGNHSWNKGKYGLYWKDTQAKGTSFNLTVKNVRMEQGQARGGHIIHIEHNFGLQNVVLENIYGCHGGPGGFYLRRCKNVTLQNVFFSSDKTDPVPVALDIDESCSNVVLINSFFHTGAVNTGQLVKTFGTKSAPRKKTRLFEVYERAK